MLRWLLPLLLILVVLGVVAYLATVPREPGGPATALPPLARPSSQPQPVASPSPVSDVWEVAFTQPVVPDDRARHTGGLDTRLVALMDRATTSLDVADYDFDLMDVAQAMGRAAGRGVRVRMVTDSDTVDDTKNREVQAAFAVLRTANIPIVPDNRQPIMHNKFTVVDRAWVSTGSMNYTDGDTYRLNNNLAIFHSPELADNYTAEFEKMFVQKKFGPSKPKGVPHPTLELAGMHLENYFAPEDGVAARLVQRITQSQRRIHFLAFSFTHDGLGEAMMARARAGAEVEGVFETTGSNTTFSEFGHMRQAGLSVYTDGNPYVMHHKVILLDDRTTIFGSFNFSQNADKDNDENLLIVDDPAFTALFEQEFQRVLALAKNPPGPKQTQTPSPREQIERQQ